MIIRFKPIQPKDLEQVIGLFREAADKISKKNIDHWQYWKNPPSEKIKWVEDGLQNKEYFFVENSNQDLIGMVRILEEDLMYWGSQSEKAKYVHSLVIREPYNGKGIGELILQKIGKQAKAEGCKYLRLDADSGNPKLCNYYEKQGFKKVGSKPLSISTYNLYEKEVI